MGRSNFCASQLYGLLRAGLPSDKLLLAQVEPDVAEQALKKVRDAGIVQLTDAQIRQFKARFVTFANKTRLTIPAPGSRSTYGEFLKVSGLNHDAQAKFAPVYLRHRGNGAQLWDEARKAGLGPLGANGGFFTVRRSGDSIPEMTRRQTLRNHKAIRKMSQSIARVGGTDVPRSVLCPRIFYPSNSLRQRQLELTVNLRQMLLEGRDDPPPRQLIRYQFGNHLGSSSLELDDQAQIISYEEYAPYGSSTYQAVRSQPETAKRYRYTGKERDEESGFYYHGARYHALWLWRWTNCDPAGARISHENLDEYVRSSPLLFRDPTGNEEEESVFSEVVKGDFHEER